MKKYAVCMGVDDYSLWNNAKNLPYAASSAFDFSQLLVDTFGFEGDNVSILWDNWCTRGNIISAIAFKKKKLDEIMFRLCEIGSI